MCDSKKNECLICYENIDDDDLTILACAHNFHYDCIVDDFKYQINIKWNKKLECPYCRNASEKLPMKKNRIPIKNINKNYNYFLQHLENEEYDKIKVFFKDNNCHAILKTGKNKGCQCTRLKKNGLFCAIHSK